MTDLAIVLLSWPLVALVLTLWDRHRRHELAGRWLPR